LGDTDNLHKKWSNEKHVTPALGLYNPDGRL